LALGEPGVTDNLGEAIAQRWKGVKALQIYKGSAKQFFVGLAHQLGVATTEPKVNSKGEETGERNLTADELKDAIAEHLMRSGGLLVLPEAKRLSTGIRYWLEDVMCSGVLVCAIAVAVAKRDIFLEMLEVELEPPDDYIIRQEMKREAKRLGLNLSDSRMAELQTLAGRNPLLARKAIRSEQLGLNEEANPEHSQYVNIAPLFISGLMAVGILRFVGMGTGDRGLYIVGGMALIIGMMLKQLGSIKGARRKVGQ